eukprot:8208055-Pyramimonas_sp.AAC.1
MTDQSDAGSAGIFSEFRHRSYPGGEWNSPVAEWLNRGLMDNPSLGHFFGVRKCSNVGRIEFSSDGVA